MIKLVLARYLRTDIAVVRQPASVVFRQASVKIRSFSSLAPAFLDDEDDEPLHRHCETCSCESHRPHYRQATDLPPPLPEPKISVRRRVMPDSLIALNSPMGRSKLTDALLQQTAASYLPLMEHFSNQSDPAFCGITTLQIVLNSFSVDPNIRWRGGWRYYGDETTVLDQCCLSSERVRRIGVTMEEFKQLGTCKGLTLHMKRPDEYSLQDFRTDIRTILLERTDQGEQQGTLVVSFGRAGLGQTGDGHFSPLAAYHMESDSVLVLDVARFKYQPYWVKLDQLYDSMMMLDPVTQRTRGWYCVHPPSAKKNVGEGVRPAHLVPTLKQGSPCPVNAVKIDFCKNHRHVLSI
jgi:glutathione gamma-glutamylcysteinyltransferase